MKNSRATIVILVTGLSLALAGCTDTLPTPQTSSEFSELATTPPQETQGSHGTPTSTPTPTASSAIPITAICTEILDTGALKKTEFTFVATTNPPASPGSLINDVVTSGGITCTWTNTGTGSTLVFAAAHLGTDQLAQAKAHASSNSTPTTFAGTSTGASGFFTAVDGVGHAQLVTDKFWIVMQSQDFVNAQDSVAFMSMVESALIFYESK